MYLCVNRIEMETIKLKINKRTSYGKALLELIKIGIDEKKGVEIVDENEPNSATIKAIEDVEKGKTFKVKNSKDLFKELGI
ncbi:hypothetical protein SAMN04488097_0443 [Epilithonimonas lactis]|nr:hypothetical protein SAMN04488097_0443 [Epilithonimonas lactis]